LTLANTTTAYIPIRFKVPYTPMDAVGAATDGWLNARLRIYWNSVTEAESGASLNPPTTVASGSSSLDTTEAPAASLSDDATGIKLTASAGVVPTDAELKVTSVTSGADFTKAESALKEALATDETPKFKLFDISLIQSKVAIQPNGTITLSVPIPSDYDKAKVVFYRINDDGTATLIKGKVSGSNYEVALSRLSLYALVEGPEAVNNLTAAGDISKFTDITGHWAYEFIKFAVENGLFNGTSETTFSPNLAMDRGMFVTVLGRLAGIDAATYIDTPFTDVKAGAYYAPYAAWASANNIVEGVGGGLFAPAREITRQEMATMLNRYINFAKITLASNPQAAFADDAAIASWAKDSVYALAFAGLLNGVGDNNYAPTRTATRAEVATLLTRFVQNYAG
ncbi:MAG: S-layer homology domain-containing protein, partial [Clostridiales Family XIII bacterium]|nr:S-layer homology domain-containing protein [Clostridiales Family XIII bacterium]